MINIDFDKINDELVYEAFGVEGNEADALNDSYLELFELIGRDAMLKLFKHFRGDKIDCPCAYNVWNSLPILQSLWQIGVSVLKLQGLEDIQAR